MGTVNVSPHIFSLYLADICSEFARMGFINIVVYVGHGGTDNTDVVKSVLTMLLRRNPLLRDNITLSLFECSQVSETWCRIMDEGEEKDFHAGWVETALMMYWKPELGEKISKEMEDGLVEYINKLNEHTK